MAQQALLAQQALESQALLAHKALQEPVQRVQPAAVVHQVRQVPLALLEPQVRPVQRARQERLAL